MWHLSTRDFVHWVFCPWVFFYRRGVLSVGVFFTGVFVRKGFVHWGFCPMGVLSTGGFVHWGFVRGAFVH